MGKVGNEKDKMPAMLGFEYEYDPPFMARGMTYISKLALYFRHII